jgi:hypothetical protein
MYGKQNHFPTWMSQGYLNFPRLVHDFPKCLERIFPRFDPEKSCSPKDHINNFYLVFNLMNVEHEDAIYRLLHYTFKNKSSMWY